MKYFQISAEVELDRKPEWLDDFRKKYDQKYPYHITLKNPTFLERGNAEELKHKLEELAGRYNLRSGLGKILFKKVFSHETSSGWCIMVKGKADEKVFQLQEVMSRELSEFGRHVKREYQDFEKNFVPHITIGRHLTFEKYRKASAETRQEFELEGRIYRIALTIVEEPTEQAWTDPDNKFFIKTY